MFTLKVSSLRLSQLLKACSLLCLVGYSCFLPAQSTGLLELDSVDDQVKRVLFDKRNDDTRYQWALGAIERIDGRWQPESSRFVQGSLRQRTLEFDANKSVTSLFQRYQTIVEKQGGQLLFECRGRDCGRSNNWANGFFRIPQLYGREDSQRMVSLWLPGKQGQSYVTLYMVRRGNNRIYLQQDLLQTSSAEVTATAPSQPQLQAQLSSHRMIRFSPENGALTLRGDVWQLKPTWQQATASLLNNHDGRFTLTAHAYQLDTARSKQAADLMLTSAVSALVKQGIDRDRLTVLALGSLAPLLNRQEGARLELLLD